MNDALRVLIVDDEPLARSRMASLLGDLSAHVQCEVVGEAANGREALTRIGDLAPDMVLIDIQMPGMNGVEAARHAQVIEPRHGSIKPVFIFCTAFDEYAVQAFEVQAIDYLLKPVNSSRLYDALIRARSRVQERRALRSPLLPTLDAQALAKAATIAGLSRKHLSVAERGRVILVPIADVIYLRSEAKYTTVRVKEREHMIEESLASLEEEFSELFVRIHRNALVAKDAIAGYTRGTRSAEDENAAAESEASWHILLRDVPETLAVSRRQWPIVKVLVRA